MAFRRRRSFRRVGRRRFSRRSRVVSRRRRARPMKIGFRLS